MLGQALTTEIEGYKVELEIDPKADPPTQCWVFYRKYCGSLSMLSDMGYLLHNDNEHYVPAWIIEKIEEWASSNGY